MSGSILKRILLDAVLFAFIGIVIFYLAGIAGSVSTEGFALLSSVQYLDSSFFATGLPIALWIGLVGISVFAFPLFIYYVAPRHRISFRGERFLALRVFGELSY